MTRTRLREQRLPYDVVTLYFTCESAGTAVVQVIVAEVDFVLDVTPLIQVCAFSFVDNGEYDQKRADGPNFL